MKHEPNETDESILIGIEDKMNREKQLLDLSGYQVNNDDISIICAFLADTPSITNLDASSNSIGAAGAKILAKNSNLLTLDLYSNIIKDDGAKALALNSTLTSLDVGSNFITGEGAKALITNTSLLSINIAFNRIDITAEFSFVELLKNNTNLIDLSHNFQNPYVKNTIAKILQRNKVLPWLMTVTHARLLAQAQRSYGCLLGILPVEVLGIINNFAVSDKHYCFFIQQIGKRPTKDDILEAKKMALLN